MNNKDGLFLLMWILFPIYMFLLGVSTKASMRYYYASGPVVTPLITYITLGVAIIFGLIALIFWIWMFVDMLKNKEIVLWKKILYFIAFFALAFFATSGYYLNNKRKNWDPEKKDSKKLFWVTVILFIVGIFAPIVGIII